MFLYEYYGTEGRAVNILLLNVVGFLVNGPYALITTAVSAELGTHHSLEGNSKALATVTAIIDGTGSVGMLIVIIFIHMKHKLHLSSSKDKKLVKKRRKGQHLSD